MNTTLRLASLLVLLALAAPPARAQAPVVPRPVLPRAPGFAAPPPAALAAPAGAGEAVEMGGDGLVSLKFNETPLETVLDQYSQFTGRTILLAPGVKASITLRSHSKLTQQEAIEAIEAMLAMNSIGLVKEGEKFLRVVPIQSVIQEHKAFLVNPGAEAATNLEHVVSEILTFTHVELADVQKAIAGLTHPYASVQPLERINGLLITDTAANLARVKEIIALIDKPIEMEEKLHIIQIRHAKASEVKSRLEEIIATTTPQETRATVARPAPSGPPGVIRATVTTAPTAPGRATMPLVRTAPVAEPAESDAHRDIIQPPVKIVADDRSNILIIITKPRNMDIFNKMVEAIDIETAPDVSVKVFRLEYADAEAVASMLNDLIGAAKKEDKPAAAGAAGAAAGGEGATETRSTALEEYVRQMREIRSQATGTQPTKSKIGELSQQNIKILPDKRSNALIIMASKSDMATLEEIIQGMDIMLSQVAIEAVILSVSLDDTIETGVDWVQRSMIAYDKKQGGRNPLFGFAGRQAVAGLSPQNALSMNSASSIPAGGGLSYYFTIFNLNADLVLKLSASDSRSRVLSAPVILTTDNTEASINVATERYFYKGQKPVSAGSNVEYVEDVELREVGINLTVTPRINKNKFVVMEIKQTIDTIAGEQAIPNRGNWPIVGSRELSASIAVNSGETIMLGGLSSKENSLSRSKIPILGDIPFLGIPFRNSKKGEQRSEILVFITPYVLDTPEEIAADATRRRDALDVKGLWKRGWSASKLAEPSAQELRDERARQRREARGIMDAPPDAAAPDAAPAAPEPAAPTEPGGPAQGT